MTGNRVYATTEEGQCWSTALYGLARGIAYPNTEWVITLLDSRWPDALANVLHPLGLSEVGVRQAIEALPTNPEAALQALQVEYTYLFINAVPRLPAPPYASAYADRGLLMGKPAEDALYAYRQAGLILAEEYDDLPDHLAAELQFLAWLGEQANVAHNVGDEGQVQALAAQQQTFLEQQVRSWLPEFCQRVDQAARIPFYREIVRLIQALLLVVPTPVQ